MKQMIQYNGFPLARKHGEGNIKTAMFKLVVIHGYQIVNGLQKSNLLEVTK